MLDSLTLHPASIGCHRRNPAGTAQISLVATGGPTSLGEHTEHNRWRLHFIRGRRDMGAVGRGRRRNRTSPLARPSGGPPLSRDCGGMSPGKAPGYPTKSPAATPSTSYTVRRSWKPLTGNGPSRSPAAPIPFLTGSRPSREPRRPSSSSLRLARRSAPGPTRAGSRIFGFVDRQRCRSSQTAHRRRATTSPRT